MFPLKNLTRKKLNNQYIVFRCIFIFLLSYYRWVFKYMFYFPVDLHSTEAGKYTLLHNPV